MPQKTAKPGQNGAKGIQYVWKAPEAFPENDVLLDKYRNLINNLLGL